MELLTTILEILAACLVVYGVWLIYQPAAFIVAGASLVAISYGLTPRHKAPKP